MRLKNCVISLERVQVGNANSVVPDGVIKVENSSDLGGIPKDIGFGIMTLSKGTSEALADYSHFNIHSVRNVIDGSGLVFSGSLSAPTEDSKAIEGSVLLIASQ